MAKKQLKFNEAEEWQFVLNETHALNDDNRKFLGKKVFVLQLLMQQATSAKVQTLYLKAKEEYLEQKAKIQIG